MTEASTSLETGDAAALLLAVLTLAATTINEQGSWEPTGTAIAVVVGVIVVAYTHHSLLTSSRFQLFAMGLAYASSLTVALAWFAQRYIVTHYWSTSTPEATADYASLVAAVAAAVFTLAAVCGYRCHVLRRRGIATARDPKIVGRGVLPDSTR